MKTEYKMLIGLVLFILLISYLLNDIGSKVTGELKSIDSKYEKHIGNEFIMNSDTLIIVDYSIWEENFTLSNGKKVHYSLIAE